MDNGPEMIAWALRDWCRLSGTTTRYIEPGAPWENPFVESFNGRFRDECLNIEDFGDLPPRHGSLSRTGESSTTPSGLTRPSVVSPPLSSPPDAKNRTHVRRSTTISATITITPGTRHRTNPTSTLS